jgi:hypothetical protein
MNAVRLGSYSDPLDRAFDVPQAALEIDDAIALLVTTGDAARGDMTLVVAAAGLALAFGQRLDGLALPQARCGRSGSGRVVPGWSGYNA